MEYLHASLDDLLRQGTWSRLLADAGLAETFDDPDEDVLARGLRRFAHIDDPTQIRFLLRYLEKSAACEQMTEVDVRRLSMLHVTIWGQAGKEMTLEGAAQRLRQNPRIGSDLQAILAYRLAHTHTRPLKESADDFQPLAIHGEYTRDEGLTGLGHWTMDHRPEFREGVLHLPEQKIDAFFVTLNKTEDAYSPTTMYEDYVISQDLFHWQSQSTTSRESPTGQRYIRHREFEYTPILFVRENKKLPSGLAAPYAFLGPAEHVSHEGDRPISIVWRLKHAIPARLLRLIARQTAG